MKRYFSVLLLAVATLIGFASCTEEGGKEPASVTLEIADYTLPESASFGEAVPFTVTLPEGASATNVTAALIKDGKQLASTTVREAVNGAYGGDIQIPYTKNIEDGSYDVMIVAVGKNSSDRAEKTVKISLAHPEFTSMSFVAADKSYKLSADGNVWTYTGPLPAKLSGYFEGKTADGTCTFGGSNVDNVEFGNSASISLYSYETEIPEGTISFDVVSFQVKYPLEALYVMVPETADPAYPGVVEQEFKKGQIVAFAGLGDLWVDVDFFDNNGDGTYTFRAEGGKYRLTNQSDWGSLRVERLSDNGDLGTFRWDDSGNITVNEAIWCLGNYNFGKPDKREVRDGRQFSDWETFDGYCMAKIDDYKYQITLRVHNYASLKFFQTKLDWGDIASANYDMSGSTLENIYLISVAGSDGNFQQGQSIIDPNKYEYPNEGVVLRFVFDVTNPLGIKATVTDVTDQNLM